MLYILMSCCLAVQVLNFPDLFTKKVHKTDYITEKGLITVSDL